MPLLGTAATTLRSIMRIRMVVLFVDDTGDDRSDDGRQNGKKKEL